MSVLWGHSSGNRVPLGARSLSLNKFKGKIGMQAEKCVDGYYMWVLVLVVDMTWV